MTNQADVAFIQEIGILTVVTFTVACCIVKPRSGWVSLLSGPPLWIPLRAPVSGNTTDGGLKRLCPTHPLGFICKGLTYRFCPRGMEARRPIKLPFNSKNDWAVSLPFFVQIFGYYISQL